MSVRVGPPVEVRPPPTAGGVVERSTALSSPRLRRALTYWDLVGYELACMAPFAPLSTLAFVWRESHGLIVLAYVLGAACMYFTAKSYAVMTEHVPTAGSVYGFARHALGNFPGQKIGINPSPQPFGPLSCEDRGALDGHTVGQQDQIAGGDASLPHKASRRNLAEHLTDQNRAVEALGDFCVSAAERDVQVLATWWAHRPLQPPPVRAA